MDLAAVPAVESGPVVLLEFTWPWPPTSEEPLSCIAYAVMKRAEGFVLCIPAGYLSADTLLEGLSNEGSGGLGPSLDVEAPAVRLTSAGDWQAAGAGVSVAAVLVDLSGDLAAALSLPDLSAFGGIPFEAEDPGLFPLASDVLRQAREWAAEAMQENRSGYQTAVEDAPAAAGRPPKAKPKRHTVATLASEQAALHEVVRNLAQQVAALLPAAGSNTLAQGPAADPPPGLGPLPVAPQTALTAPLASALPPAQHVPKAISQLIGPPPPTRQQPKVPSPEVDHEERLARITGGGDAGLPSAQSAPPDALAAAVLAQSNALVSLVGQLASGSAEPLLDAPSATSVRGALGRQRLQQELLNAPGTFSRRVRQNAMNRMNPTGLGETTGATMTQYLERYGGYGKQRTLALLAWLTALASDHLDRGSSDTAADLLALMQLAIDQANLDGGDMTFAWILSLQADPPASLYQDAAGPVSQASKAFSQLADQKWITTGLSFLKEVEAIGSRRSELAPSKRPAATAAPPPAPKSTETEALSKKQARAAAWAAKRAAAAAKTG